MSTGGPALSRRTLLTLPAALVTAGRTPAVAHAPWPGPTGTGGLDATDEREYWALVRASYLVEPGLVHLNAGTCGLQTHETAATEVQVRRDTAANFNRYFYERLVDRRFRDLCARVATYVGADVDDIAFTTGATEGMNFIANGLDLAPGDEVVTTTHEHQAGIYPWLLLARRRGVRVTQVPWPDPPVSASQIVDVIARALTPRTRVLSICHVTYTDGTVLPVAELCALARARGIITVVDGAQSVGMIDFAIRDLGCDFFATSLHKWLGAPYGTGLLWVSRAWRDRLWPTIVESHDGWDPADRYGAVTGLPGLDFVEHWPATMVKFARNLHYYAAAFWAIEPTLAFRERIGRARAEQRIRHLAARLRSGLERLPGVRVVTPADPALSGGIVSFRVERADPRALARAISREDRLTVRSVIHEGIGLAVVRACPHVYNSEEDIDRLVEAVRRRLPA